YPGVEIAMGEAVGLLATRTAALGLSREIRDRSAEGPLATSPFFRLPRVCDALLSGSVSTAECHEEIRACRAALEAGLQHLEAFGVSVDVVYRIEVIGKNLDRLDHLLDLLGADSEERPVLAAGFLARFAAGRVRDRSIRDLLRTNLHFLARK